MMSHARRKSRNAKPKKFESAENENPNVRNSEGNGSRIYSTEVSEQFGRYLVANRNIEAGEMIIEDELPLVVGPVQQSKALCLGCYIYIQNVNNFRCQKCKWPLCQSSCRGLYQPHGHTMEECIFLLHVSFDAEMKKDEVNTYNFIVPLRCLLLKQTIQWDTIRSMESHNEIRRQIKSIWEFNENSVVEKLSHHFDSQEVHTVCGVLEVNSFEVTMNDASLRALFPVASLMVHDCTPNTVHMNDENFNLKVRASVPIRKGQSISTTYAYTLQGTASRRAHIKQTKFFDCACRRCSDPSELGTNISTLVCPNCNQPTLMPASPLDLTTQWICKFKKCTRYSVSQSYVDDLVEKLDAELKRIPENDVRRYEEWVRKASKNLHEHHYLVLGVEYTLGLLYGKIPGFMLQDMSEDLLRRKMAICEKLLKIADILEPGLSRLRGIVLYELHAPIMMLLQRSKSRPSSKKQLKHSIHRVMLYLTEASEILKFESPSTMEGKLGSAAQQALLATTQWKQTLGQL